MIHAAHASRYHWSQVGTHANLGAASGRCHASTSRSAAGAGAFSRARCLAYVEIGDGIEDWDLRLRTRRSPGLPLAGDASTCGTRAGARRG